MNDHIYELGSWKFLISESKILNMGVDKAFLAVQLIARLFEIIRVN